MRSLTLPALLALSLVLSTAGAHAAELNTRTRIFGIPEAADQPVTDRLIVKYRNGSTAYPSTRAETSMRVAGNRQGVSVEPLRRMANGAHVFKINRRISAEAAERMAQALRDGDPNVEYAEPDRLMQPTLVPTDAMYNQQWSLFDATAGIRAPTAWDKSSGKGIVVAVIDSGVRPHADLVANLVAGYDFISDPTMAGDGNGRDRDASDAGDGAAAGACGAGTAASRSSWHGTHVAGIVAAVNNTAGVVGVAYGAKVQPLRALGRCGGYTSDVADAIAWAAGNTVTGIPANPTPARVINLSLGGTSSCGPTMQNAINAARGKGALVVVAAGNANTNASTASPANCSGVLPVAATGITGGKASYSNFGAIVALAAPGGDGTAGILSTLNTGTTAPGADSYAAYKGTSMAAPVVSGVAALMMAAKPSLTADQVAALLKSTATPFAQACSGCGSGIVNAAAAVNAALGATTTAPAPTPAPTPAPVPTTGAIKEIEPNNTLATAQAVSTTSATTVAGALTAGDLDHYRITVAAGKRILIAVTPASTTAAGLTVYHSTGQSLLSLAGAKGAVRQISVTNAGKATLTLVARVDLSSGAPGSYTLKFTP